MVKFKTWRDSYIFMKDYGRFTCLNCDSSGNNLDTSVEHTDMEYSTLFCIEWIAMVNLNFQFVCEKWKHNDKTITEDDRDCSIWDLSDEILKKLDESDKKWTIEEIRELVENEEVKA